MEVESLVKAFYEKAREIDFLEQTTELDPVKFEQFALHKARCDLEPYVYNYLENKYGNQLTDFWKTPPLAALKVAATIPFSPGLIGVFV